MNFKRVWAAPVVFVLCLVFAALAVVFIPDFASPAEDQEDAFSDIWIVLDPCAPDTTWIDLEGRHMTAIVYPPCYEGDSPDSLAGSTVYPGEPKVPDKTDYVVIDGKKHYKGLDLPDAESIDTLVYPVAPAEVYQAPTDTLTPVPAQRFARIDSLEARVKALECELVDLRNRVGVLHTPPGVVFTHENSPCD